MVNDNAYCIKRAGTGKLSRLVSYDYREVVRLERKESFLEKTSAMLDLPGDVVAGLPRIELLGDREFRMEYHKGILAYGVQEIHISGGKLVVRVKGENLELRSMNPTELLITGRILGVEFT